VLAGGLSTRLPPLKALLPIDGVPAVVRTAETFREVDVEPLVVVGFAADELAPVLDSRGLRHILNEDFERGMYSSLQAGVRGLDRPFDWLFVQPADCPLVRGETIGRLMRAVFAADGGAAYGRRASASRRALVPTCRGQRGHPPLLASDVVPLLLVTDPPAGLRSVLGDLGDDVAEVPVDDEGILLDMDDPGSYARIIERALSERVPDAIACEALLRRRGTPPGVVSHSLVVRDVALLLAGAANPQGLGLDRRLLEAAALTHDIARGRPDHARAGAELLAAEGYPRVARVVRHHMTLPGAPQEPPGETEILYLADKLVRNTTIISLEERRAEALARFSGDSAARGAAAERLAAATAIAGSLERYLRRPLLQLLASPQGDVYGRSESAPPADGGAP
jgi:molybdenum cofactor cytidylyltransferase